MLHSRNKKLTCTIQVVSRACSAVDMATQRHGCSSGAHPSQDILFKVLGVDGGHAK